MKFEELTEAVQDKAASTLSQLIVNERLLDEGLAKKAALAVKKAFETLYKSEDTA